MRNTTPTFGSLEEAREWLLREQAEVDELENKLGLRRPKNPDGSLMTEEQMEEWRGRVKKVLQRKKLTYQRVRNWIRGEEERRGMGSSLSRSLAATEALTEKFASGLLQMAGDLEEDELTLPERRLLAEAERWLRGRMIP